ncbi:MAG: 1-(5-phosphoribosyl)-5-[(5-phosphoribosylamino)methylideneamino]imidazole-4-carboxamide isomerase [Proteobacteria bacterium]|nr:1-(5-phosphoribosyl)-5-[(5-phosphoribosylamino)methylideneamino]imidazole-4-carboxamide isomerase [Pseudomonadota bacterium]
MILFPAIDLKDGACVRLRHGDMASATIYNLDPAQQARAFAEAGFPWLHVVDLDGAVAGWPINGAAVDAILSAVDIPVQLGGGIRDMETVESWLMQGVKRVILGTAALKDPQLVREACRRFPGQVLVSLDARGGMIATEGWALTSNRPAIDLALSFEDAGVAALVYTDIGRDGELAGVNVEATVALASRLKTPVIASGGIAGLADIQALKAVESNGIAGAIIGRALYDGRLDAAAALRIAG